MDILSILLIAVGLSMDCFAVSVASGASIKGFRPNHALLMAAFFGGFQFSMAVIGWFAGTSVSNFISGFDHFVAFGLLAFIGGKMIYEATMLGAAGEKASSLDLVPLVLLSLATSIDALAVGASFGVLNQLILLPSIIIGLTCFLITLSGGVIGERVGHIFENRIEVAGGVVLILIGLKILLEHLF